MCTSSPITEHPTAAWATQPARNFLADAGERADRFRYLIRDRDSIFTEACDAVFPAVDIEIKKSAPQCPKMNVFAPFPAHRITRTKILGGLINEYDIAA